MIDETTIPFPSRAALRTKAKALAHIDEVVSALSYNYCVNVRGGYPGRSAVVGDCVVLADVDHDEAPTLTIYDLDYCHEWIVEAFVCHKQNPDEDAVFCWEESRPQGET